MKNKIVYEDLEADEKLPPKQGVDRSPEGMLDDPATADRYAAEHGIDDNSLILYALPPQDKEKLLKMCKHGEFNQLEASFIRYVLSGKGSLEDIGAMLGATSSRTHGQPMSKQGANGELWKIIQKVKKRSKLKYGKPIDLAAAAKLIKKWKAEKKLEQIAKKKADRELQREFYAVLHDLNTVQRQHGIKPSRPDIVWPGKMQQSLDGMQRHQQDAAQFGSED